jgi:hypothetical protein
MPRCLAVLAGLLLALLPLGVASPAAASCAYRPDDPELFRIADVIFTGVIISDRTLRGQRRVVFAVDAVHKGQAYAEQLVVSDTRTSVTFDLAGPGRFVVYGRLLDGGAGPGTLESDNCSGSRAGSGPASLGPGYPPVPNSPVPNSTIGAWDARRIGRIVAGAVVLSAGAIVLVGRRRRRRPAAR